MCEGIENTLAICWCKTIAIGFFILGHMDENINGSYGYLSKKLKKNKIYVLVDLMKFLWFHKSGPSLPN